MLSLGSENGKNPEGHLSFNHLVSWEFGSLQDSNLGLKWLGRVLNKFPSLNLVQKKGYRYMLYIMDSFHNYKGLRLGDWKGIGVRPSFLT